MKALVISFFLSLLASIWASADTGWILQSRCMCVAEPQAMCVEGPKTQYRAESYCYALSYAKDRAMKECEAEHGTCQLRECYKK